jgi:pyruvate dehydrogenase E2 component (dihydrolipoamide acetyltransferase)
MTLDAKIHPVTVPKWGLTMDEGTIAAWHVAEGTPISIGDELVDIETSKVTNSVQAPVSGVLRRILAQPGQCLPCGALIGVIAAEEVPEAAIAAFIASREPGDGVKSTRESGDGPQVVEVNGVPLRYLISGDNGTPVVFLHGLASDLESWQFVQSAIAQNSKTLSLDLPGHGDSGKDLSAWTGFDDIGGLINQLIDRLGFGKIHLVAHSMGACIALSMARRVPERLSTLTLVSPAGFGVTPAKEFMDELLRARARREVQAVVKYLFADEHKVSRAMVDRLLNYKRIDGVEAVLQRFAELLAAERRTTGEALAGIRTPVHIIWGTRDRIIPLTEKEALRTVASLNLLEGVGHIPQVESPAVTVGAIQSVISR